MQLITKDFKAWMQPVLAFLLKCNCSVESKKVNNKAESLWCFLMGAIKILDLKDNPWRKEFFRTLNIAHLNIALVGLWKSNHRNFWEETEILIEPQMLIFQYGSKWKMLQIISIGREQILNTYVMAQGFFLFYGFLCDL